MALAYYGTCLLWQVREGLNTFPLEAVYASHWCRQQGHGKAAVRLRPLGTS